MVEQQSERHRLSAKKVMMGKRQQELNIRVDKLLFIFLPFFSCTAEQVFSNSRNAKTLRYCFYTVLRKSGSTLTEIAITFRKKEHTSIARGIKTFRTWRKRHPQEGKKLTIILENLTNHNNRLLEEEIKKS